MYIYIYIYVYTQYYIICVYCTQQQFGSCLLFALCQRDCSNSHEFPAPTGHFLTFVLDLVLWKCCYGPWDHFMFSAKNWIRPAF